MMQIEQDLMCVVFLQNSDSVIIRSQIYAR